jgi:hypothetical protein
MNEVLSDRAAGLATVRSARVGRLPVYRGCGRALRERCAPSVLPWPDHSALVEDAARGLIMYGAWG